MLAGRPAGGGGFFLGDSNEQHRVICQLEVRGDRQHEIIGLGCSEGLGLGIITGEVDDLSRCPYMCPRVSHLGMRVGWDMLPGHVCAGPEAMSELGFQRISFGP